jgi:hypothetical protein
VAIAGVLASVLSQVKPRAGFVVATVMILLCLVTASAVGIGK